MATCIFPIQLIHPLARLGNLEIWIQVLSVQLSSKVLLLAWPNLLPFSLGDLLTSHWTWFDLLLFPWILLADRRNRVKVRDLPWLSVLSSMGGACFNLLTLSTRKLLPPSELHNPRLWTPVIAYNYCYATMDFQCLWNLCFGNLLLTHRALRMFRPPPGPPIIFFLKFFFHVLEDILHAMGEWDRQSSIWLRYKLCDLQQWPACNIYCCNNGTNDMEEPTTSWLDLSPTLWDRIHT